MEIKKKIESVFYELLQNSEYCQNLSKPLKFGNYFELGNYKNIIFISKISKLNTRFLLVSLPLIKKKVYRKIKWNFYDRLKFITTLGIDNRYSLPFLAWNGFLINCCNSKTNDRRYLKCLPNVYYNIIFCYTSWHFQNILTHFEVFMEFGFFLLINSRYQPLSLQ